MDADQYLEYIGSKMPDEMSTRDITKLGFFKSRGTLRNAQRYTGNNLPYKVYGDTYVYRKEDVLKWIRTFYVEGL